MAGGEIFSDIYFTDDDKAKQIELSNRPKPSTPEERNTSASDIYFTDEYTVQKIESSSPPKPPIPSRKPHNLPPPNHVTPRRSPRNSPGIKRRND